MSDVTVKVADQNDLDDWSSLRASLWPSLNVEGHRIEVAALLAAPEKYSAFIAYGVEDKAIGFAEASVRHDYVNGCETSPVAFLEGIFVVENQRSKGVARLLIERVVEWARSHQLCELASDANIANLPSHHMHTSLGFEETERVVYFRRDIR